MSEAEKTIGRKLADAVNCIPTAAGQKYFLGFVEGAAAMATELGAVVPQPALLYPILPRRHKPHNPKLMLLREYASF